MVVDNSNTTSIPLAFVGGLIAALVGAGIWALLTIVTGYEFGFMAVGVGALCGFGVILFSKGQRGIPLQLIAVVLSLVGIFVGKYVAFSHFLKATVAEEYGAEIAVEVSALSLDVLSIFIGNIGDFLSPYDLLWVVFAVGAAWKIPKARTLDQTQSKVRDSR
ncbi:MAG: hypothetical protein JW778_06055 [Candidatus Altiarchaeota archaeon]|nr:hypothetical protein [Candidatus Altiarchaeota archaeon]